jgi:DNA polymerase III alpha subunit
MEIAPLTKDSKTSNLLCALDMYSFELAGLVKFDLLGLKALDGLYEVNQLIKDIDIGELSKTEEALRIKS